MDEQVYVQVFFLDNSYKTFLVSRQITAEKFTMVIAKKLGFQQTDETGYWFGLYESFTGMVGPKELCGYGGLGRDYFIRLDWRMNVLPSFRNVVQSPWYIGIG